MYLYLFIYLSIYFNLFIDLIIYFNVFIDLFIYIFIYFLKAKTNHALKSKNHEFGASTNDPMTLAAETLRCGDAGGHALELLRGNTMKHIFFSNITHSPN